MGGARSTGRQSQQPTKKGEEARDRSESSLEYDSEEDLRREQAERQLFIAKLKEQEQKVEVKATLEISEPERHQETEP